jgi:hypothetical protein
LPDAAVAIPIADTLLIKSLRLRGFESGEFEFEKIGSLMEGSYERWEEDYSDNNLTMRK